MATSLLFGDTDKLSSVNSGQVFQNKRKTFKLVEKYKSNDISNEKIDLSGNSTIKSTSYGPSNDKLGADPDNNGIKSIKLGDKYKPKDIANLIVNQASDMAIDGGFNNKIDIGQSQKKSIGLDENKLTISQKLSTYWANKALPTTTDYRRVFNTYNGFSINENSVKMTIENVAGIGHVILIPWSNNHLHHLRRKLGNQSRPNLSQPGCLI